jgi:hypothetical protein
LSNGSLRSTFCSSPSRLEHTFSIFASAAATVRAQCGIIHEIGKRETFKWFPEIINCKAEREVREKLGLLLAAATCICCKTDLFSIGIPAGDV